MVVKPKDSTKDKVSKIAEILGLLEETHLGKDWLVAELKKHKIKVSNTQANSYKILIECPPTFVSQILRVLNGEDIEGFEDDTTLSRTYHWFFTDIVAGSNPNMTTKDQVRKIKVLNELISRTAVFKNKDPTSTVILPTGDGMAIGFSDSAEKPLSLAIDLHKFLNRYNESLRGKEKLLIRVGIDMGPVFIVKDLNGMDNVWGPGIILTRRVMDLGGDMNILASKNIAEAVQNLRPEYKAILHDIGDYSIKHGEQLYIYNIYGDGFGNKIAPRKSKIKKETLEDSIKSEKNFAYNGIEIILDVLDTKTWLTHHTWIWNVVNIAKEPKEQIFYFIDGDVPKDFADMKVKVTDEKGNNLSILSVGANKPTRKEFNVKLHSPVLPKQRRLIKMEYDWEEPERVFFYQVPSDCKQFTYVFNVPKGADIQSRVLKVDTGSGNRIYANPTPVIKFLDDRTSVSWGKTNLKAHDAYEFRW